MRNLNCGGRTKQPVVLVDPNDRLKVLFKNVKVKVKKEKNLNDGGPSGAAPASGFFYATHGAKRNHRVESIVCVFTQKKKNV